ncbi:MAG TPA: hypothetical protein DCL54_12885 [Alphaproteobacteria bacterium]|nr:hypothetical protein [Alphaproteobacteria bacterium]HAJ47465.1 hypothetical protein [Alphaproteobacteria bacterium]
MHVNGLKYISIRDLQKMSERAILALPGATRIQSGDRAIGLLIPFRKADPAKVKDFVRKVKAARIAALKAGIDEAAEDRLLAKFGVLEPMDAPPIKVKPKVVKTRTIVKRRNA